VHHDESTANGIIKSGPWIYGGGGGDGGSVVTEMQLIHAPCFIISEHAADEVAAR
jgi:hypothetical protein